MHMLELILRGVCTLIRGILALCGIWCMFFGYIGSYSRYDPSAALSSILGIFLLAMAYEAYVKPLFFLVPVGAMLGAYLAPADSKAILSALGMMFGTVISSRAVASYYRERDRRGDS